MVVFNWSSLKSWDADNHTISAEDFYNTVYAQDFDNDTAKRLQEEALKHMKGFLDYNVYDTSDEEEDKTRQENMGDASYASELARTMQMYNLVTQNKPETTAAFDVAMFSASAISNFIGDLGNAGYNLSKLLVEPFEGLADFTLDTIGVGEDDRGGMAMMYLANPAYLGGFLLGETMNFIQAGGDVNEFVQGLQEAVNALWQGDLGERFGAL